MNINVTSYQTFDGTSKKAAACPCHVVQLRVGIQLVPHWQIRPQFGPQSKTPGPGLSLKLGAMSGRGQEI
jgi:hypothetical protein